MKKNKAKMAKLAEAMVKFPELRLNIHPKTKGKDKKLCKKRAKHLKKYLGSLGISHDRIDVGKANASGHPMLSEQTEPMFLEVH